MLESGVETCVRRGAPGRYFVLALAAVAALVGSCSQGSSSPSDNRGGSQGTATGGSSEGVGGGSTTTNSGGGPGLDGGTSDVADAGFPPPRPFWCSDYAEGADAKGWVKMQVTIPTVGTGGMSSPILDCQLGTSDWSLSAGGLESDGVDLTYVSLKISGTYQGPGRYKGTLTQGISASLSHSDVTASGYLSVPGSDCEICINDDGLSGAFGCWALEATGQSANIAYIEYGTFTCPNAQPKPADAPTDPPGPKWIPGGPSPAVLCHYLWLLNCSGRPLDEATCIKTADALTMTGRCYGPWEKWLECAEEQSAADFRCGTGMDLEMASGACSTELAAERSCRDTVAVMASPECDALCAKGDAQCQQPCDRETWCAPWGTHCAAAKRAWLACSVQDDHVTCGTTGFVVLGCEYDDSVCP
jgi:hypothetical protein